SVGITGMFGFSMITLFVSLNTKLQMVVPDAFRGRVLSLYSLGLLGLSPFGALALGAFAEKFGVATAIGLSGALVIILAGAILLRYPILIHHDDANSLIAPLPLENTATGD